MAKKPTSTTLKTPEKRSQKPFKKEGNAYDKIFKEVIEKMFIPLIEKRMGIKIVKSTPLKEKMQTTIELEMDFFYEIVLEIGETFILHLEFESGNNLEMIYRVGEYHGFALRRKKMPIKHIVIYLGNLKPTMRTKLRKEEIYEGFDLLDAHTLNTNELLSSQIPEVVLLAVLSDYPIENAEFILRLIIENLKILVRNKRVLKKYVNQLMMLSRLRKIEALTIKISEEMPIHIDYESDTLYLKGTEKGIEKGIEKSKHDFVKNLILSTDFSNERIALLADVNAHFVAEMRVNLSVL